MIRWDGAAWREVTPDPTAWVEWMSVAAPTADDVWVAGADQVWRFDGAAWVRVEAPAGLSITALRVDGEVAWAAGQGGQILSRR